jgi:hypothetical protein
MYYSILHGNSTPENDIPAQEAISNSPDPTVINMGLNEGGDLRVIAP